MKPVCLGEGQATDYSIQTRPAVLHAPPNCPSPLKLCSCEEHNGSAPKRQGHGYSSSCHEPGRAWWGKAPATRGATAGLVDGVGRREGRRVKRHF